MAKKGSFLVDILLIIFCLPFYVIWKLVKAPSRKNTFRAPMNGPGGSRKRRR